jgi:hypothetical protein
MNKNIAVAQRPDAHGSFVVTWKAADGQDQMVKVDDLSTLGWDVLGVDDNNPTITYLWMKKWTDVDDRPVDLLAEYAIETALWQ